MDRDMDPSTRSVKYGESVGRTNEDPDVIGAVILNRSELALNGELWRAHMARRVETTTVVVLIDPARFVDQYTRGGLVELIRPIGSNGNGKHKSVGIMVEGT